MPSSKNLRPYKPEYSPTAHQGDEQLPNESIIPPPIEHSRPTTDYKLQATNFPEESTEDPSRSEGDEGRSNLRGKSQPANAPPPPPTGEGRTFKVKSAQPLTLVLPLLLILLTAASFYSYFELQPKVRGLAIARDLSEPAQDLVVSFGKIEDDLGKLIGLVTKSPITAEDKSALLLLLKEASGPVKEEIRVAEKSLDMLTDRSPSNYPGDIKEIIEETDTVSRNSDRLLSEVKAVADHYYSGSASAETGSNYGRENDLLSKIQAQSRRLAQLSAKISTFRQNHQFLFFK